MAASKLTTWLITGASSGLGKSIALQALQAGYKVIGTTRDVGSTKRSCPELEKAGGIWVGLDPAGKSAQLEFSKLAEEHSIDVLVNNAGYALLGAVEDTSDEEVQRQMEVNFYGPLRATRAVLPGMRERKRGEIILISSGAGIHAKPARASYSASKFAIEGVCESLSQEVAGFGIKVLIVEPGAFRTPFSSRMHTPARYASTGGISDPYRNTPAEQVLKLTQDLATKPDMVNGDPDKAGHAIVQAVESGHSYLRLPLGSDCVASYEAKVEWLQKDLNASRSLAISTDIK